MENGKPDILAVARKLVAYVKGRERHVDSEEVELLWEDVQIRAGEQRRAASRRRARTVIISVSAAAACVCAVLTLGHFRKESAVEPLSVLAEYADRADAPVDRIMLLSPEMEGIEFGNSNADIIYDPDGTVTVNTISLNRPASGGLNRLLVPKGKRASLTLSDGTHLWVNSGSRVIFPGKFSSSHREIYVEGEAYMDVAHNAEAPFTVMARDFRIKVLGTSFNVSAYPGGQTSSVVLVGGCVNLSDSEENIVQMAPGQIVNVRTGRMEPAENVDVEPYVCWVRNMLICKDETLENVFRKLNLAYDREFVLGPGVSALQVSGKLNLKDSLEDVLHTISFSAPVYYELSGGKTYVWKK